MADQKKSMNRVARWGLVAALLVACGYAGLQIYSPPPPEVPTARVERRDFVVTIRGRGEVKSTNSATVTAPQTPDLRIARLAENGKPIRAGEVVVEFDPAAQEDQHLERQTEVRQADSEILQAKAQHSIADEQNSMLIMQSGYNVERAKLEASKQEILSEIEGLKNRINVTITEGELSMAETNAKATDLSQDADLARILEQKSKAVRDLERTKTYLKSMVLRAPRDGIVIIQQNFRAGGSFGTARPPFQEGDTVWAGATIAEIPDLSSLRVEFRVEEIDRGRVALDQPVRIRVDAVPDTLFQGKLEWLSPIATLLFRTFPPEKNFPAHATIENANERLRPGMSASVEVIVERQANVLIIPTKASFQVDGEPTVFVKNGARFEPKTIEVADSNGVDLVVSSGVNEGDNIALVDPRTVEGAGRP